MRHVRDFGGIAVRDDAGLPGGHLLKELAGVFGLAEEAARGRVLITLVVN